MRISLHEVEAVKFRVTFRGYAEDEVDTFLDLVVETIGEYERSSFDARTEIDRLRSALDECREARIRESGSSGSLMARFGKAEDRLSSMMEEATRTSERIVEEALEAGEHILDQLRTVLTASRPPAEDGKPGHGAETDSDRNGGVSG